MSFRPRLCTSHFCACVGGRCLTPPQIKFSPKTRKLHSLVFCDPDPDLKFFSSNPFFLRFQNQTRPAELSMTQPTNTPPPLLHPAAQWSDPTAVQSTGRVGKPNTPRRGILLVLKDHSTQNQTVNSAGPDRPLILSVFKPRFVQRKTFVWFNKKHSLLNKKLFFPRPHPYGSIVLHSSKISCFY